MSGPEICKFFLSGRRRQAWHVGIEVIVLSHFLYQADKCGVPSFHGALCAWPAQARPPVPLKLRLST